MAANAAVGELRLRQILREPVDADAVVNVDLASKTVSVSSAADVQQLKQAIEKAGFVVTQ